VHAREQKAIVRAVADGSVDVVIGTHRLLAKDVAFHDLGLLIIDEEQRFGVRQKEALKKFRAVVDVLALSATPIPRTLYQSLTSARDMSTILTPPEDRLPVKTLLIKRDWRVLREAIRRELARGGQVFFLHNRIETINRACDTLRSMLPEARFVVAHGQMNEDELAETMEDFGAHKYDVLTCTMIIESGLDMPNVNTIIVDNAHIFGLADLYQLRGRVGRANRQAYAYLVIPTDLTLDGAARHRLKALLDNTALGSGYAIAMKDLEIRGAGNLLGAQQSGHIAAIGFGLYCRLLQRAVQLVKSGNLAQVLAQRTAHEEQPEGERPARFDWRKEIPRWQPPGHGVELHLPFSGNIPEEYIESPALRLDIFRRIGQATQVKHLRALEEELRDRFGPLPDDTLVALRLAEARLHARYRGVDCVEIVDDKLILRRRGVIVNPTQVFPRTHDVAPLAVTDVMLATLARMHPPSGAKSL
jgi:transcription-repair coupling factor (superfamily II helicase)